jgi:hypothetical protein
VAKPHHHAHQSRVHVCLTRIQQAQAHSQQRQAGFISGAARSRDADAPACASASAEQREQLILRHRSCASAARALGARPMRRMRAALGLSPRCGAHGCEDRVARWLCVERDGLTAAYCRQMGGRGRGAPVGAPPRRGVRSGLPHSGREPPFSVLEPFLTVFPKFSKTDFLKRNAS